MNTALVTQLRIMKLVDMKPNFSELARLYDVDRRTVKNIMMDTKVNLKIEISPVS